MGAHCTAFRDVIETPISESERMRMLSKSRYTKLLDLDDPENTTGLELGILHLDPGGWAWFHGHTRTKKWALESALVVLSGKGRVTLQRTRYPVERSDIFSESPWAFNFSCYTEFTVHADAVSSLEVAVVRAENSKKFEPAVLSPDEIPREHRGKGLADDTMERYVKAIFGDPNAPSRIPESNLVVGEVVNFPGKWSSYPPHFHPQTEVYYYRFDKPQGFGVSVLNDRSHVVRTHDVMKITDCTGHAQVAAPGYAMWYLWVIRQIEGQRYEGNPPFTYFPEHRWVLDSNAPIWTPEKK